MKCKNKKRLNSDYSDCPPPKHSGMYEKMVDKMHEVDYETLPKKPFFKARGNSTNPFVSAGISPGKKVRLRSECIEQLDKWHDLIGVIGNKGYKEMKDNSE